MVEVKVGQTLPKDIMKSGMTDKGKWVCATVAATQGYDKILVWASNAEKTNISIPQRIKTILSVKKTARKYEKDGEEKWVDVYNVQAEFEPDEVSGFSAISDEEVPF